MQTAIIISSEQEILIKKKKRFEKEIKGNLWGKKKMTELSMKERDFKCKFIGKCTTTRTLFFLSHTKREKEERMREVIKKNWQLVLQIPFQFSIIIY